MEDLSKAKIWKYLDLPKLVSLLTTRSIYFACPTQFKDPYEGWVPRSHAEAHSKILQNIVDQYLPLKDQLLARGVPPQKLDDVLSSLAAKLRRAFGEVRSKFGVSCWHASEHESDAMWKLYCASGQGIAIESTIGQLRDSLGSRTDLLIDRVRYMDFDRDPIEKGHQNYSLFIKRTSFEHEKELRATILLQEAGKGEAVRCDLDVLITRIQIAPLSDGFVRDAIEALCKGEVRSLSKPVCQSPLYTAPDYGIDIRTP